MTAPSTKEALELKPCPFCNGDAESDSQRSYRNISTGNLEKSAAIYCTKCSADMTWCYRDTPEIEREQVMGLLIEQWNTRATLQPSGERREAIARIICYWDETGTCHDNYCAGSCRAKKPNAEFFKAADEILASGLVQDEAGEKVALLLRMIDAAGGEIDSTENVHSLLNYFCDDRGSATDTYNLAIDQGLIESSFDSMFETSRAWLTDAGRAAIRSARDGGAES